MGSEMCIRDRFGPIEKMNIYLDFRRFTLPRMPLELQEILGVILPMHPALQHKLNSIIHLKFERPQIVTHILKTMHEELENRSAGYQETVDYYFRLFLIECCRQALNRKIQRTSPYTHGKFRQLEDVRHYIDRNFTKPLSLNQLAKRAGRLNPNYLSRRFKEYTGQTVMEYINHRRIEMSLVLLRSDVNSKILQVSMQCGFNDISYFNRMFKKIVGVTPSEYRDQNR